MTRRSGSTPDDAALAAFAALVATERDSLATVVEQVAESVIITDLDARITYVNPAFERVTGYSRDEVIGQNPSIISAGVQPRAFYQAMWAALTSGVPWVADFINRRKDGTLFTEEAVISPIRDQSGATTSYVAVKRDVTRERALEVRSAQLVRERALIAETIHAIEAVDSPETTAQAICQQVVRWSGISAAELLIFELDGRAAPIGFVAAGKPDPPLLRLPTERSKHLRTRAREGPWIEPWVPRRQHPYNDLLTALGRHHLMAYAPMRSASELIGLLAINADESVDERTLAESMPGLVEFADLAAAIVGRVVAERTEVGRARESIRHVIATSAFEPVFQPIVDLEQTSVIGYEALTRFSDGIAPDVKFAEAAAAGQGLELETATLEASLAAAADLPSSAFLALNVSPELIIARQPLKRLVNRAGRRIVLEVTEHAEIINYDTFRSALAVLRPRPELAVDDAGAGFASLRHILELRPAFVKLDRSLVAGVESDEARQAMIVGLRHFARSVDCQLIAEGIETEAELTTLRSLDVGLGQGFLLRRPERVQELISH
ncbi:MAG TPA: EAL domain-containing protein [Candidatus Limnocylindria bacterium]|nr:EAL domain-containing protein [Candidatus Limnocylindria bacterium]